MKRKVDDGEELIAIHRYVVATRVTCSERMIKLMMFGWMKNEALLGMTEMT